MKKTRAAVLFVALALAIVPAAALLMGCPGNAQSPASPGASGSSTASPPSTGGSGGGW
jgi:hypothetical protein